MNREKIVALVEVVRAWRRTVDSFDTLSLELHELTIAIDYFTDADLADTPSPAGSGVASTSAAMGVCRRLVSWGDNVTHDNINEILGAARSVLNSPSIEPPKPAVSEAMIDEVVNEAVHMAQMDSITSYDQGKFESFLHSKLAVASDTGTLAMIASMKGAPRCRRKSKPNSQPIAPWIVSQCGKEIMISMEDAAATDWELVEEIKEKKTCKECGRDLVDEDWGGVICDAVNRTTAP